MANEFIKSDVVYFDESGSYADFPTNAWLCYRENPRCLWVGVSNGVGVKVDLESLKKMIAQQDKEWKKRRK